MNKFLRMLLVVAIVGLGFIVSNDAFAQKYYTGTVSLVGAMNGVNYVTISSGGVACSYAFPSNTTIQNQYLALALSAQAANKNVMVYSNTPCAANSWGSALSLYTKD